ncbi:MAG TPA: hypothetical protein VJ579_05330 [Candidatus Paceibacterota bacterium]|nr:hypothetical protein [Candidatus Paceibacterota bacterium]
MSDTYSSRKALKLATALYMVTDIMSEKEPLKWHLRDCAVALLGTDAASMLRGIEQTLDILSIARIARAVSPMNADVLEEELKALEVLISARGSAAPTPAPMFTHDFFEVLELAAGSNPQAAPSAQETLASYETSVVEDPLPKTQAVATPVERKLPEPTPAVVAAPKFTPVYAATPVAPKETPKPKPVNAAAPQGIRSTFAPHITLVDADVVDRQARTEETRSSRREVILSVIGAKENCSIKDIATKLSSVSEKTIQRELSAMVEEGILVKEGDRRWSTYRVARTSAL